MSETKKPKWIEIGGVRVSPDMPQEQIDELKRQVAEGDVGEPLDVSGPLKRRVNLWLDYDLFAEIKRRTRAETAHGKYQTYLNDYLRRVFLDDQNAQDPLVQRVETLENEIKELRQLVKRLA